MSFAASCSRVSRSPRHPLAVPGIGALLLACLVCLAWPAQLRADAVKEKPAIEVDQIIDVEASEAFEMFQFKPGLLRIPVGTRVRFLNMRGQHTVVSLRKMWPKEVPTVNLTNLSSSVISFNKPGVYPFTCKVHGRYGMVMLIAVGDEYPNLKEAKERIPGGLPGKRMRMFIAELEGSKN